MAKSTRAATSAKGASKTSNEAQPPKPPRKRNPPKKPADVINEAKDYVSNEVAPTVKKDVQKFLGLPKWVLWAVGAIVALVLLSWFVIEGCDKKKVESNNAKQEAWKERYEEAMRGKDSAEKKLLEADMYLREAEELSAEATGDRERTEREGEKIRLDYKKVTDEIIKDIKKPGLSDADRDAITEKLTRAREALKRKQQQQIP